MATSNGIKRFFERTGKSTSKFGVVIQLGGLVSLFYGIYLVYPPAMWILSGLVAVFIAEKL